MTTTRSHYKSTSRVLRTIQGSPKLRSKFRLTGGAELKTLLTKGMVLVSVGTKYHQGEYIHSTLGLLGLYHNQIEGFNSIDVLVAGSLQRHNYWNFSELLSNEELGELFEDVQPGLTVESFADLLAAKFYTHAKKAEAEFIQNYSPHFSALLPLKFSYNFIPWEQMVPIPNSKQMRTNPNTNYGGYKGYHAQVIEQCREDKIFAEALTKTSDRILTAKQTQILAQSKRIRASNHLLDHLTDKQLNDVAALCCFNFLVEECPLLFPELTDLGYTSIIYPSNLTDAFKATVDLYSPKNGYSKKMISWINIIHEDLEQNVWHYSKSLTRLPSGKTLFGRPWQNVTQRSIDKSCKHSGLAGEDSQMHTSQKTNAVATEVKSDELDAEPAHPRSRITP
jgi:hypothetical protein